MLPLTLQQIAEATGGTIVHAEGTGMVGRVWTDSRTLRTGDFFVALDGDRFDGHDYVPQALAAGASAAMVSTGRCGDMSSLLPRIEVKGSTRGAYGALAAWYRRMFQIPVIAVAGSNGKTSTKDLIASVLAQAGPCLASEGSFNNDVGVPATLLRLGLEHSSAVIELGTNHPGELAPLVRMAAPTMGVLTSIGREHMEFFGDLTGVAQEEGWLSELLPSSGSLVVNGDAPEIEGVLRRCVATVTRVGYSDFNDWHIHDVKADAMGSNFCLSTGNSQWDGSYRVNLLGQHQVLNASLALWVGKEQGLGRAECQRGLEGCKPAKMRLEVTRGNGWTVLNDAYNANADSMLAALGVLKGYPCPGRRVAVLGEMGELGNSSAADHAEVGRYAAAGAVDYLITVGTSAAVLADGARRAGLKAVHEFAEAESAGCAVLEMLREGDVVLVKASRSARLERVVSRLVGEGT